MIQDEEETEDAAPEEQKSVILHLLKQLSIGKVSLLMWQIY